MNQRTGMGVRRLSSKGDARMFVLANLDQNKLKTLADFEQKEGVKVLAFTDLKVAPAKLDDTKMNDLHSLEQSLGVTLVAYQM